jgi:hypothetical protein
VFILIFIGYSYYQNKDFTFIDKGLIIEEDAPDQDMQEFEEDSDELTDQQDATTHESIKVKNPKEEQVITSPLVLEGEVKGNWLFEATAPIYLTNWNGLIIAEGYIEAEEEWMTTDFVPFTGKLDFDEPENIGTFSDYGSLIFQKNNPSGLSELDDAYEFRVKFR